ncbi:MAG: YggT family protein [Candidatus Shapirobacteria bacterium]
MTEITKETIMTQGNSGEPVVKSPVVTKATNSQTYEYLVYYFFGALEIFLAFRLILKLAGANSYSAFVGLIYGITGIFILPFQGIFRQGYASGAVTTSVLEPSTLVALIVYAVLAWGIVKLLRIFSGEQQK